MEPTANRTEEVTISIGSSRCSSLCCCCCCKKNEETSEETVGIRPFSPNIGEEFRPFHHIFNWKKTILPKIYTYVLGFAAFTLFVATVHAGKSFNNVFFYSILSLSPIQTLILIITLTYRLTYTGEVTKGWKIDIPVGDKLTPILTFVLGQLLSLRTSTAYERWMEARKAWTDVIRYIVYHSISYCRTS